MISFFSETNFTLDNQESIAQWITDAIQKEGFKTGDLQYTFLDDEALLVINKKYLQHNFYTDIISFDYTLGKLISGEMFLSIDRIKENANTFNVSFLDELHRVIIHGILHYCGYKDKEEEDIVIMRSKEDYYLSLRPKF